MSDLLVSWPLGDPGDFEIRQEGRDVHLCFRRSDHEWLIIPTSLDVVKCMGPYLHEFLTLADAVVPLFSDDLRGIAEAHAAPHLPTDPGSAA
jgi:hypothetical protein